MLQISESSALMNCRQWHVEEASLGEVDLQGVYKTFPELSPSMLQCK